MDFRCVHLLQFLQHLRPKCLHSRFSPRATHIQGTSNFLRAAFIVSLNPSSFGSTKNIPHNCLALSSFGFSIAHLCFPFFFAASDINFHISGHTSSGREVFCFLVSLAPDHEDPSGGLSFSRTNLVNPVHASDNSFSPSTLQ